MSEDKIIKLAGWKLFLFSRQFRRIRANLFSEKVLLYVDWEEAVTNSCSEKEAECQAKMDLIERVINFVDEITRLADLTRSHLTRNRYEEALLSLNDLLSQLEKTSTKKSKFYETLKMTQSVLKQISSFAQA